GRSSSMMGSILEHKAHRRNCGRRHGRCYNGALVAAPGPSRMRIVDIRETALPINSQIRNSSFDFSEMTTSVVAVITDVVQGGRPITGFAFNSTGRYACGAQMRARFIPRLLRAAPE